MSGITVEQYFQVPWRPVPEIQPQWQFFFDGCAAGKLLVELCSACGVRQFYPRGQCMACGGTVTPAECSGRGIIHTFTTVRISRDPAFSKLVPYHYGIIELDEGLRMAGGILGDSPAIEARMIARFGEIGDSGVFAPVWIPET